MTETTYVVYLLREDGSVMATQKYPEFMPAYLRFKSLCERPFKAVRLEKLENEALGGVLLAHWQAANETVRRLRALS